MALNACISWTVALSLVTGAEPPAAAEREAATEASGDASFDLDLAFAAAEERYLAGDWAGAIATYTAIFARTGEPVCLANIGRLHEERAELELAREAYGKFLRHPRAAEYQRAEIRRRLAKLAPDSPAEAASPAPPVPTPTPAPSTETSDRAPRQLPIVGGVLLGVAVPAVVAGGILAGQSASLRRRSEGGAYYESTEARRADVYEAERRFGPSVGLLVCGGIALTVGVIVTAVGARRGARHRRRPVEPAGPGLVVRF